MPAKQKDIRVAAGERVQIDVILDPASNNGVLFGSVSDQNGSPLEDVIVTVESDGIPQLETRTAPDGSFRFEGLPTGTYLLIFRKNGYPELKREQIELASGGNQQVNVQLVAKTPQEKAIASIKRKSTGISWTYSRDYLRLIPNSQSIYSLCTSPWWIWNLCQGRQR